MLSKKELHSLKKGDVIKSLSSRALWETLTILDIIETQRRTLQILARESRSGEYRIYDLAPGQFNLLYLPYNPDGEP